MKHISGYSPLSYPGSKRLIRQDIVAILQQFGAEHLGLCSPFMGGASVELHAAKQGIEVHASDAFKPLVEFWKVLISQPQALSRRVYAILDDIGYRVHKDGGHHPDAKKNLGKTTKLCLISKTPLERAAYFYIRNKTSYGAMMFKGTDLEIGKFDDYAILRNDNRIDISMDALKRLHDFYTPMNVACIDYRAAIYGNPHKIFYCDPPYVGANQQLYGCNGDMQKGFDHQEFFRHITSLNTDFVISYDNHPYIRELYSEYYITTRNWTYGMTKERKSDTPREFIICSDNPF